MITRLPLLTMLVLEPMKPPSARTTTERREGATWQSGSKHGTCAKG